MHQSFLSPSFSPLDGPMVVGGALKSRCQPKGEACAGGKRYARYGLKDPGKKQWCPRCANNALSQCEAVAGPVGLSRLTLH